MSVHQESLDISKPVERREEAPELAYRAVSHDSLSMFLAAIGGAVLGMLLTLLILALINGGTLSFSGGERLTVFEATLERVNDNVGAVSTNVDLVSQQAQAVSDQLNSVESALRAEMSDQDANLASLSTVVTELDVTRQQFDLFMGALGQAMSEMQGLTDEATEAPAAASEAAAPEAVAAEPAAAELFVPTILSSEEVPADAINVLLFVDANGNGTFDADESVVSGATVALFASDGPAVASASSTATGVLFGELSSGDYVVSVEDAAGYTLTSEAEATVTVADAAEAGQIVYISVAE